MTTRGDQILDRSAVQGRRQGPVRQGAGDRARGRPRRTSRCIRSRTCRWTCPTASCWRRCWSARTRATPSSRTRYAVAGRAAAGRGGRHLEPAPRGAAARAAPRPAHRAAARQPRHAAAQARRRRLRRHRAGRRRADAARPGRAHPRASSSRATMLPAAGQGALGIEVRARRDRRCASCSAPLTHRADLAGRARRARGLARAGRQLQHAAGRARRWDGDALALDAALGHADERRAPLLLRARRPRCVDDAQARALGERAAALLRDAGARRYLASALRRTRRRAATASGSRPTCDGAHALRAGACGPVRVLVTRPAAQAAAWVDALRAAGVDAAALPLIGIAPAADRRGGGGRLARPGPDCGWWCSSARTRSTTSSGAAPAGAGWPPRRARRLAGPGTTRTLLGARRAARGDRRARRRRRRSSTPRRCGRSSPPTTGAARACWSCAARAAATGSPTRCARTAPSVDAVAAYRRVAPELDAGERALLDAALADAGAPPVAVQQLRGDRPPARAARPRADWSASQRAGDASAHRRARAAARLRPGRRGRRRPCRR